MEKSRVIQWLIIIFIFGVITLAGQQSWLVVYRDLFIVFLLIISFISVSLVVYLNRKSS